MAGDALSLLATFIEELFQGLGASKWSNSRWARARKQHNIHPVKLFFVIGNFI
jgi:hypothetical protein